MHQQIVTSLQKAQSLKEHHMFTIYHFVFDKNNKLGSATMSCSAVLIHEEPCRVLGTSTVLELQACSLHQQGNTALSKAR